MPRQPRIDAPGFFYHAIARGIERRAIFLDDEDKNKFLDRLGKLCLETETPIYAYALIPNHFHLLLRRGGSSISMFMHRLLTFYAIYFNKKYMRAGHLFQNRYKDVICRDEIYFLQLVRYINLNPVRAGLISTLEELAGHASSGHGLIMGIRTAQWFDPAPVLAFYGEDRSSARAAYAEFMAAGLSQPQPAAPEFVDNLENLSIVAGLDGEKLASPSHGFMKDFHLWEMESGKDKETELLNLFIKASHKFSVSQKEIQGKSRERRISAARAFLAHDMQKMGMSQTDIARNLSVSLPAVSKMLKRSQKAEKV